MCMCGRCKRERREFSELSDRLGMWHRILCMTYPCPYLDHPPAYLAAVGSDLVERRLLILQVTVTLTLGNSETTITSQRWNILVSELRSSFTHKLH